MESGRAGVGPATAAVGVGVALLTTALAVLWPALPAASAVLLQWDSDWLQLQPHSPGTLAVVLNDSLDLRTVELRVQYDPALITGVDAGPGALFLGVPGFIWEAYEEATPGSWHGFAVIIGGDCLITGPGELFVWEFTAGANTGVAQVVAIEVTLYAPDATRIPDVSLRRTFVSVGEQPAVSPPGLPRPEVGIFPNPFNPRVQIRLTGGTCADARLDVFDLQGRRQASLFQGPLVPEGVLVDWDGRDQAGTRLPSGTYLFRCWGPGCGETTARGVLLR